jgi:hypothetical protein
MLALRGFETHRQADFLRFEPSFRIVEFQAAHSGREVGAFDGSQTISLAKHNRRNSSRVQAHFRRESLSLEKHLALTHEGNGHLRHGREIAASAHRPFLAHDRCDPSIEHLDLDLHDLLADPRMSPAVSVEA